MSGFFKKMFSRIRGKDAATDKPELEKDQTVDLASDVEFSEDNLLAHGLEPEVTQPLIAAETVAAPHSTILPELQADEAREAQAYQLEKATEAALAPAVKPPPKTTKTSTAPAKKTAPKPTPAEKKSVQRVKKSAITTVTEEAVPAPQAQPEVIADSAPQPAPEPAPSFKHGRLQPVAPSVEPVVESSIPEATGWLSRLTSGLSKSSRSISTSISSVFTKRKLDAATLQDFEDVLIQADLGVTVSERIVNALRSERHDKEVASDDVRRILAREVENVLQQVEVPFHFGDEKPFVILVVGVNGAGKTTTIGKLGAIARAEGYQVMFAACDTFRAAAIEQLTVWGERIGARVISRPTGADSSGLAFDAMKAATTEGSDILFIDTAGRLQNKAYLMDELEKIVRVIRKTDETAPHAVLLVLDATTGQNALAQADVFTKVAGVTGIIMTKLDGTARGGILVAIAEKFKIPIHAIGVGEAIEDLQPFDAKAFAQTIAGLENK